MLRFLTAGESHGKNLTVIVEGIPANLPITEEYIERHMARRQVGYGRGGRMQIEKDRAEILAGVRHGLTIGSPISMLVVNRDFTTGKGPGWRAVDRGDERCALRRPIRTYSQHTSGPR